MVAARPIRTLLLLCMCLLLCTTGRAVVVHYTDKAAFLSATGAASATGALPELGTVSSPQPIGSVSIALATGATQLHIGGSAHQSSRLPGAEISVTGSTNLNITLSTPSKAFGFDFTEPQFDPLPSGQPFADSIFEVTLKNGATRVGRFQFNAPNDSAFFLGLASSATFSVVEIREISGGPDDEFLGEIFSGADSGPVAYAESGEFQPEFAGFDAALRAYLDESCFPGVTAAATYDGRLVYRRSYGWTDYTHSTPLHYSSPMGIGSCSKPLTSVFLRNLIRAGLLVGTEKLVTRLGLTPPPGLSWAEGFADIDIHNLLDHTSGIPMYRPDENTVGALLGLGRPANFAEIIAWQGTQPLLFQPDTGNSYSNFGYAMLGAVAEKITGERFEKSLTEQLAEPLGAYTIRGHSDEPYLTPVPPGVFPATLYANNDAAAGLRSSAPDYCRFLRGFRLTGTVKSTPTPGGTFIYTFHGSVDDVLAVAKQRQSGGHALEWVVFTNDRGYNNVQYLDNVTTPAMLAISSFPSHDYFPYLNWKMSAFWNAGLGAFNTGAADTDDLDRDTLPTVLEYAFNRLPKTADLSNSLPSVLRLEGSGATSLEFRRVPLRNDITYEVLHTTDLAAPWVPIARSENGAPMVSLYPAFWTVAESPVGSEQRIVVTPSSPSSPSAFFRIRVTPVR